MVPELLVAGELEPHRPDPVEKGAVHVPHRAWHHGVEQEVGAELEDAERVQQGDHHWVLGGVHLGVEDEEGQGRVEGEGEAEHSVGANPCYDQLCPSQRAPLVFESATIVQKYKVSFVII